VRVKQDASITAGSEGDGGKQAWAIHIDEIGVLAMD